MPTVTISAVKPEIAVDALRACLAEEGRVIPGKHFLDELRKENLTIPDAWHVLRRGHIYKPPERDIRTMEWKYTVEGSEPDGKYLNIVFTFKQVNEVFLITVFSVATKGRTV